VAERYFCLLPSGLYFYSLSEIGLSGARRSPKLFLPYQAVLAIHSL
jgi:hypothetical protein